MGAKKKKPKYTQKQLEEKVVVPKLVWNELRAMEDEVNTFEDEVGWALSHEFVTPLVEPRDNIIDIENALRVAGVEVEAEDFLDAVEIVIDERREAAEAAKQEREQKELKAKLAKEVAAKNFRPKP
jgi:hypothetical protein